jgi:hypothetical protein
MAEATHTRSDGNLRFKVIVQLSHVNLGFFMGSSGNGVAGFTHLAGESSPFLVENRHGSIV